MGGVKMKSTEMARQSILNATDKEFGTMLAKTLRACYSLTGFWNSLLSDAGVRQLYNEYKEEEDNNRNYREYALKLKKQVEELQEQVTNMDEIINVTNNKDKAIIIVEGARQINNENEMLRQKLSEYEQEIKKLENELKNIKHNVVVPKRIKNKRVDISQDQIEQMFYNNTNISEWCDSIGMTYAGVRRRLAEDGNKVWPYGNSKGRPYKNKEVI